MLAVGFIAKCCDHKYIILTDLKPEKGVPLRRFRKIWVESDGLYSQAVFCHSKSFPVLLEFKRDFAGDKVALLINQLTTV